MNSVGIPTDQSDMVMWWWLNKLWKIHCTLRKAALKNSRDEKAKLKQAVEPSGGCSIWGQGRRGRTDLRRSKRGEAEWDQVKHWMEPVRALPATTVSLRSQKTGWNYSEVSF